MIIERRSIIKGLVALVAAPAIVKIASIMPVNAALQPMRGLIVVPQRHVDVEFTSNAVMRDFARELGDNNIFLQNIDHGYDAAFAARGAKIGTTLRIRLPSDYVVSDGPGLPIGSPCIAAPLALAATVVAIAPEVLKTPVTRRFWA